MKSNKKFQELYVSKLAKELVGYGEDVISKENAEIAAVEVTKVLVKAGNPLDLKNTKTMAKWIIEQKMRVDEGELVYDVDGTVTDVKTGKVYKK